MVRPLCSCIRTNMVPFNNVNSLRALAKVDGYSIVVSNDTIIPLVLAPEDIDVMLAADQPWKTVNLPTTVRGIEGVLDKRQPGARPVLFYTQTMDVHELGKPDIPKQTSENWRNRPGFDNRLRIDCLSRTRLWKFHCLSEAARNV